MPPKPQALFSALGREWWAAEAHFTSHEPLSQWPASRQCFPPSDWLSSTLYFCGCLGVNNNNHHRSSSNSSFIECLLWAPYPEPFACFFWFNSQSNPRGGCCHYVYYTDEENETREGELSEGSWPGSRGAEIPCSRAFLGPPPQPPRCTVCRS